MNHPGPLLTVEDVRQALNTLTDNAAVFTPDDVRAYAQAIASSLALSRAEDALELASKMAEFTDPLEMENDDNAEALASCVMWAGKIFDPDYEMIAPDQDDAQEDEDQ